jgi:hypothetical protein
MTSAQGSMDLAGRSPHADDIQPSRMIRLLYKPRGTDWYRVQDSVCWAGACLRYLGEPQSQKTWFTTSFTLTWNIELHFTSWSLAELGVVHGVSVAGNRDQPTSQAEIPSENAIQSSSALLPVQSSCHR